MPISITSSAVPTFAEPSGLVDSGDGALWQGGFSREIRRDQAVSTLLSFQDHAAQQSVREASSAASLRMTIRANRENNGGMTLNIANWPLSHLESICRSVPPPPACLEAGRDVVMDALGEIRHESGALVLVIRLLDGAAENASRTGDSPYLGLPKWRLRRAKAYIEENLEETISLAAIANAAGLSPTYFAAQFKVSVGLRPHDYVMRRRIERAKEQLLDPNASIIEVALGVGFQTQAHFTTSFKKIVGETPCRWRNNHYVDR